MSIVTHWADAVKYLDPASDYEVNGIRDMSSAEAEEFEGDGRGAWIVTYQLKDEAQMKERPRGSVAIASFVTAYARILLYEKMRVVEYGWDEELRDQIASEARAALSRSQAPYFNFEPFNRLMYCDTGKAPSRLHSVGLIMSICYRFANLSRRPSRP